MTCVTHFEPWEACIAIEKVLQKKNNSYKLLVRKASKFEALRVGKTIGSIRSIKLMLVTLKTKMSNEKWFWVPFKG